MITTPTKDRATIEELAYALTLAVELIDKRMESVMSDDDETPVLTAAETALRMLDQSTFFKVSERKYNHDEARRVMALELRGGL